MVLSNIYDDFDHELGAGTREGSGARRGYLERTVAEVDLRAVCLVRVMSMRSLKVGAAICKVQTVGWTWDGQSSRDTVASLGREMNREG